MKKLLLPFLPLLALAALALPAKAGTLDTTQFGKYAEFTASGNISGDVNVANLPVPVHFSAANIGGLDYNDIGLTKQAAYSTLRFADANGDNLDYEIATWNPSGESIVWVSVPSIKNKTTKFTAYFAPDAGYTLPAVYPTNVWTKAGYIGVWHLDAKDGTGQYADSSGVTGPVGPVDSNASYPDPTAVTAYGVGNYLANNAAGLFIPASASANWDFGDTGVTFESWALPGGDWEWMFSNVSGQNVPGFIIGVAQNKIRWSTKGDGWRKTCKDNQWSGYAAEWRHFAVTYMKSSGSALSKGCVYIWRPAPATFAKLDGDVYPSTRENQFTFDNGCYLMCSVGNTIQGVDEIRIRASETEQTWARANHTAQTSGFLTYAAVKVTGAKISSTGITVASPTYSTVQLSGTFTVEPDVVGDVPVSAVLTPAGGSSVTVPVGTISASSQNLAVTNINDLLPGTSYAVNFTVTYDGKTTSSASASFTTTALPVPTLSGVGDTGATLSGAFSLSGAAYAAGTANAVFTETRTGHSVSVPIADLFAPTATATTLSPDSDYRVRFVFARSDGTTILTRTVLCSTTGTRPLDPTAYASKLAFTASGYTGSSTLANFPVLVRLSTAIDGFDYAKITASDIRFADANGTLLAHDIERWDATGTSLIWVSVPSLSSTTTTFTMYWNPKPGATVPAARAPQRVWTLANYAAVWHFNEQNLDGSYPDASGYGATAVLNGSGETPNAPTTEGTSANDSPWHVANSFLKVEAANTADWFFSETGYAVETWIKPSPKKAMGGWDERDRMFTWGAGDTTGNTFELGRDMIGQYTGDQPGNKADWPAGINNQDVWRFVTGVWKPASGASFAAVGSFCNGSTQVLNKGLAAVDFTENGMGLTGTLAPKGLLGFPIDEARIRRGETTVDWMDANYATQVAGSTFLTPGQVQEDAIPVTLTIPSPLPEHVTLVSVTTNDIAVAGVEGVYTVFSDATVVVTFAAAEGYRLVGDATVDVVMDASKTLTGIPTAELIPPPPPTAILTIPSPLPANVSLVSVTTNDVAVAGNAGVYTILSNDTVTVTFAAAEGYRLVGDATIDVVMDANKTLAGIPTAELIPPPPPTAILTIPSPLPANVSVISVTTNGVAVAGVESAYTVLSNDTVTVTFAAAAGYRLVGDATVAVVIDEDKTLTGVPTAEPIPIPTVTLTIPELPANVTLISVTTNDVAVVGVAGAYTVQSNATVVATFAAAAGYVLTPAATVSIVVDGNRTLAGIPTAVSVAAPTVSQSATKVYARQTVTLTASAPGATSYIWLMNGVQIEGGTSGTLTVSWRSPKNHPTDTYRAVAVYDIDSLPLESGASAEMTVTNLPKGTVLSVLAAPPAPPAPHDYSADYLTFRVLTPGTICWKSFGSVTNSIEYSLNNGAWTSITSTSEGATISVVQGDLVRFRGSNTAYATDKDNYSGFEGGTATYDIEGNIMSLLYGDDFAENTTLPNSNYIFCSLFKKAPVISAEHLVLPALTLKNYCYRALFSCCETLTKAPELPATTLATGCYWYMFEKCGITEAPVLNATTLVNECYGHMFEGCASLNRITCLATSNLNASNCRKDWVKNVAATGVFVKAANTTWTTGTSHIPTGWTVCEDVLLLPPEVSFFGDTIELECDTAGAEIHYRLGQTGDFALYTAPISIVADTVVEAYSAYQGKTSQTVTQTCVYVHETPFQRSNKELSTWRYGGNTITTPYSVNAIDGHSSSYAKGTFAFDTSITLREAQPTYLWFQHADQSADIYVDDVNVGTHWGGYNAFFVDISEYVHRGINNIRVALRNNRGNYLAPAAGDFNFNATLGNVKLFTSPVLPAMEYGYDGFHITSTVSASNATTNATIYVKTKVPVGASLTCTISDVSDGGSYSWTNTLASTGSEQIFTNTIAGGDLRLWNGTIDPHLYTVTLEIYKDNELYHRYQRPYGLRYYSYVINQPVNGENYTGFLLNGRPYLLRGVCMHDDVEGKANALDDSDYDQEFAIIRELGCNFIRLAHYPHPKEVYDRCDRLGIIVQTEVPCVNKLQSTLPDDYYTHLTTQYTEMVQQHFNHPCIVFWGLSNETTTDDKAFGKEKIEGYYDLIKSMDTERMVGYVMSHSYSDPSGYYNHPDVDWFGCNLYVGWYIDKTSNNPSSQLNKRIKSTITDRSKPLALSEYGCGGTQHCHSTNFLSTTTPGNYARHDIEYQMWLHEGHIAAIRNYPQLLFTGQWQLFDIAVWNRNEGYTECLDGENATTNDDLKYLNNKGLVERDHVTKKDTFYLYKAEWNSKDKFVHICGKDYTKTIDRVIKCYTNDGNSLSLYVGNNLIETVAVVDHIAEFTATNFPSGVEIRVVGATKSDTVTFQ